MEALACFRGKIKIPLLIPFRTKFNTKRIKPIHLERRILEAVTQPIYRERLYDPSKTCSILVKKQQEATQIKKSSELENRYESFLIREAWKVLDASQMVIAFQADSVGMRRRTAIHNIFYPIDLLPIYFPHEVIRKAIEPTRLRNLLPLIHRSTLVVTGKSLRVKEMIDLMKKIPDLALLGGFVGDRILTKQGLIDYAALPEMDGILGQMVGIIEALPQRTRSLLSAQQQNLSRNLDQYIAQEKDSVKSDQTGTSGEASS